MSTDTASSVANTQSNSPTPKMTPVYLRIYDISKGKVATWSQYVLRRKIKGIWHTAIHVFGFEYFYGGGINCMTSSQVESSFDMEIVETLRLGYTTKTRADFEGYFLQLYDKFTPETYDLVKWNCNHFSDTCARYLLNKGIPEEILNLPQIVGSTFIGNVALKVFQRVAQGSNQGGFSPDDPAHPRHELFTHVKPQKEADENDDMQVATPHKRSYSDETIRKLNVRSSSCGDSTTSSAHESGEEATSESTSRNQEDQQPSKQSSERPKKPSVLGEPRTKEQLSKSQYDPSPATHPCSALHVRKNVAESARNELIAMQTQRTLQKLNQARELLVPLDERQIRAQRRRSYANLPGGSCSLTSHVPVEAYKVSVSNPNGQMKGYQLPKPGLKTAEQTLMPRPKTAEQTLTPSLKTAEQTLTPSLKTAEQTLTPSFKATPGHKTVRYMGRPSSTSSMTSHQQPLGQINSKSASNDLLFSPRLQPPKNTHPTSKQPYLRRSSECVDRGLGTSRSFRESSLMYHNETSSNLGSEKKYLPPTPPHIISSSKTTQANSSEKSPAQFKTSSGALMAPIPPTVNASCLSNVSQSRGLKLTDTRLPFFEFLSVPASERRSKTSYIHCPECSTASKTTDLMCRSCGYDFMLIDSCTLMSQ